jgi:hypothetical protein
MIQITLGSYTIVMNYLFKRSNSITYTRKYSAVIADGTLKAASLFVDSYCSEGPCAHDSGEASINTRSVMRPGPTNTGKAHGQQ